MLRVSEYFLIVGGTEDLPVGCDEAGWVGEGLLETQRTDTSNPTVTSNKKTRNLARFVLKQSKVIDMRSGRENQVCDRHAGFSLMDSLATHFMFLPNVPNLQRD